VDDTLHIHDDATGINVCEGLKLSFSSTSHFNTASPSAEGVDHICLAQEQRYEADLLGNATWKRLHFYYYLH